MAVSRWSSGGAESGTSTESRLQSLRRQQEEAKAAIELTRVLNTLCIEKKRLLKNRAGTVWTFFERTIIIVFVSVTLVEGLDKLVDVARHLLRVGR